MSSLPTLRTDIYELVPEKHRGKSKGAAGFSFSLTAVKRFV